MGEIRELYAFFTVVDTKLESFLTQVTEKLGGKKFISDGKFIGVFPKAHRACHGAMYFMKKCIDSNLPTPKIVVLKGAQNNLIQDAQFFYESIYEDHCFVTDEVLKELNDVDTASEMMGDIKLPSSAATTHQYKLTKFKDITTEVSAEDLFDYTNVVESSAAEAVVAAKTEMSASKSMIDEPLEISQTNQIYDYQKEQEVRELEKVEKAQKPQEKDYVPSYANEQIEKSNPGVHNVADLGADQLSVAETIAPDMSFDNPDTSVKGIVKDKNLMLTIVVGTISLFLIGYYAFTGSIPFIGGDDQAYEEEYDDEYYEDEEDPTQRSLLDTPEPKKAVEPPKKRVFTPILTEEESKAEEKPVQTLFPQKPGDNTAYLSIKSVPSGATVFINGAQLKGVTPLNTFLVYANKPLNIKVSKTGFDPVTKTEEIPVGQRRGFLFELIPSD